MDAARAQDTGRLPLQDVRSLDFAAESSRTCRHLDGTNAVSCTTKANSCAHCAQHSVCARARENAGVLLRIRLIAETSASNVLLTVLLYFKLAHIIAHIIAHLHAHA